MPTRLIYLVAFVEGFSTLAVQIVAMRLAIPVVGSSIVLTSIFIGVILLALSAGYWSGGVVADRLGARGRVLALGGALMFAGVWYVLVSFAMERQMLEWMMQETGSYVLTLFLVAGALFILPVFVASHTIPLLTELLDEPSKGKAAGAILFISTIGSFFGSVMTSIYLFDWFGVHDTGVLVGCALLLLAAVVFYRVKRVLSIASGLSALVLSVFFLPKNDVANGVYSFDSAYQQIRVFDSRYQDEKIRIFSTNGALSSAIHLEPADTEAPFKYINEILSLTDTLEPASILVIGAAGFVYPQLVASRSYVSKIVAVDIDPKVKEIAEKYFLEETLDEKIEFVPRSARGVLEEYKRQGKKFDLIFLDAYNDKSVPEELMTKEFFESTKALLTDEGKLAANAILDSARQSVFSVSALDTMSVVFGDLYYLNVTKNPGNTFDNFMLTTHAADGYDLVERASADAEVYTDDRNGIALDSVKMFYLK